MDRARVLVVEDCRMTSLLLKHIMGKLGVQVDSAMTGEQALALALGENEYPLIFLDVMLPDLDGFEVCRRIRAAETTVRPRIYFLTAMGESYSNKHVEVDGDGVFFKPVVPSQIHQIVRDTVFENESA